MINTIQYLKKLILVFCLVLIGVWPAVGQTQETAQSVLTKMNQAYLGKNYHLKYTINGINFQDANLNYLSKGEVASNGSYFYSKTDHEVTILNKKHYLYINTFQKSLVVNAVPKQKSKVSKNDILAALDSLINQSKAKLESSIASGYIISIDVSDMEDYTQLHLHVNKKYQLTKVIYTLKKSNYTIDQIEIDYDIIALGQPINEALFSVNNYAIIKHKVIIPTEKYKTFQVIDQRTWEGIEE